MKIMPPFDVAVVDTPGTGSILTTTNVNEDDTYSAWSGATTYAAADKAHKNHRVWTSVQATNLNHDPVTDDGTWWTDAGPTNRWKMFDGAIGTQTERSGTILVTLTPAQVANGIALFKLVGSTLNVTVTDPTDGEVYNQDVILQDNGAILDWWGYFFEPVMQLEDVALIDLPYYASAVISVTIDAGADTAKCGALFLGRLRSLGDTVYGSGVGLFDYSIKADDGFGGKIVTVRGNAKTGSFDVAVADLAVAGVQKFLASILSTAVVFIGADDREEMLIYGFVKGHQTIISNPSFSSLSIDVEGLT